VHAGFYNTEGLIGCSLLTTDFTVRAPVSWFRGSEFKGSEVRYRQEEFKDGTEKAFYTTLEPLNPEP
jgi:hypothetical protein